MSEFVKVVVFVPEASADAVRLALKEVGAGSTGNYSGCSFSTKGIGRFTPLKGANPAIGEIGREEEVLEERIETFCLERELDRVIAAVKAAHSYEEPIIEAYPLI
jgi:hypothetical protein